MATDSTLWWEFQPGQRVMTREGFPGVVASVEDGPVAGAEEYIVTLDNNMGGGRYASSELKPLPQAQAQVASVEHTAADDYPELGDILVRRPDHQTSIPMLPGMVSMASLQTEAAMYYLPTEQSLAYEEQASALLRQANDTMQPVEVPDEWIETGQAHDLLIAAWGGQLRDCNWARAEDIRVVAKEDGKTYLMPPDFETEVTVDEDGKRHIVGSESALCPVCSGQDESAEHTCPPMVSEAGLWDFIKGAPPPGGVGHNWSYDWCRFRRNSRCFYPKVLNEPASQAAGYAVWVPEDRGYCPRIKWEDQEKCPVGEPGPHVPGGFTDATVAWEAGGQRGGHPGTPYAPPAGWSPTYTPTAALQAVAGWDSEVHWHFTATWADVRQKAKEIAKAGHVRILSAPGNGGLSVTAEVQGDTNIYMTSIVKVPGKYAIAYWECGCAWAAYSWGRTGKWKKFEGRMCSHALAVNYEAQRRGMFGGQVHEDRQPTFNRDPAATTKWPGDWDRNKSRYSMKVIAAQDEANDEPPAVEFVRTAMHEGLPPNDALRLLVVMGARNPASLLALAFGGSFMAKVRGIVQKVRLTAEGLVTSDGHPIDATEVLYPTYDPHLGLSLSDHRHALLVRQAAGSDPDAAARALLQLAQRNEPEVTKALKRLVNHEHGHLAGLDNRLKTPESLARKIRAEMPEHGGDVGKTAANISDSLRYTMLFRPEEYVKGARDTLSELEQHGYKSRVKNYWERGDNYNGINAAMTTPSGHPFELQFHTPQSLEVKEKQAHPLYKRFRDSSDHRERYVLDRKMTDLFDKVEQPGGVLTVPTLKRVPRVEAPAQRAAAKSGEGHTYHLLHNFEGKPIAVLRHVVNHDTPDARMEVWRDGQWVTENEYASHHYMGDPRSHIISKEEADAHIAGLGKQARNEDDPCTACGGVGEQGTSGYECYICDGTGMGKEERTTQNRDNSNPENGLMVGMDLSIGQQPVTAGMQMMAPGPPLHPDHHMDVIESDGKYVPHCSCGWTHPDQPVVDDQTLAHLLTVHHVQEKTREAGYPLLTGDHGHPDQYRTKGAAPQCPTCGFYHHPDEQHYRLRPAAHRIDPQENFEHDPGDDSITEDYAHHITHATEPGTHHRYPYDKPQYDRSLWGRGGFVGAKDKADDPPSVSGVVLKAADTGRVLMLQRALEDEKDPARGTWEFPGGHHEDGDKHSLDAAIREFEEEVGQPFPQGGHLTHVWRSGPYVGHVVVVPEEKVIKFDHGRIVPNPDDPDGDNSEQVAWWDPDHARKNPALREECKSNPWNEIKKAAKGTTAEAHPPVNCPAPEHYEGDGLNPAIWDEGNGYQHHDGSIGHNESSRSVSDWISNPHEARFLTFDDVYAAAGNPTEEQARAMLNQAYRDQGDEWLFDDSGPLMHIDADLHDEPEPALPTTDSTEDGPTTDYESMAMGLQDDVTEAREDLGLPPLNASNLLRQHQAAMESGNVEASPFAHLMAGTTRSDDVAAKAQEFLAKEGLKSFTPAERKELIEEGLDVQAANLDRLDIAGTHYEALDRATAARDEDDSVANFMMWG